MPDISTVSCISNDVRFTVLLDSGAKVSHISLKLARELKLEIDYRKPEVTMTCANGTPMQTVGTAFLTLFFGKVEVSHVYRVEKDIIMSAVMGRDILTQYRIMMDHELDLFWFKNQPQITYKFSPGQRSILFSVEPRPQDMERFGYKQGLENLIESFPTVFRKDGQIGQTSILMHKITLDTTYPGYNKPIQRPARYWPPNLYKEIERQVQDLLAKGKIRRSTSPYRFSIALDEKKDGTIRLAVNYMELNKRTVVNATPIHNSNVILRLIPTSKVFTTLDMNSSFWQVQLDPESRHLTAFEANGTLYEWNVMPFGLKGAPATFVGLMNFVLSGLIIKTCFVYLDDIIVFSKTEEQHMKDLKEIFERFRDANLTVNIKKCIFVSATLEYLGHIVSSDGIRKNPAKVRAIIEMPPPTDKEGVKRLQGFFSWVITFVPNFSTIFEPISRIAKKAHRFIWRDEQQIAFQKLKTILAEDIVLHGLDYAYAIFIRTDASDTGIGYCMGQKINGKEVIVCYGSATLSESQRLWTIWEKEGSCYN
ncbi:MAG: retropepsin-like aspartic protease/reverse transcriptase [Bacteroidota bacterium]